MDVAAVSRARTRSASGKAPRSPLEAEAFRGFPYGLVVLDRQGKMLCSNAEATRLISGGEHGHMPASCCEVLGCRRPGSSLERGCIAELAVAREVPLLEMCLEILTAKGTRPMWVSAGRFGREGQRIVVQLRPTAGPGHPQEPNLAQGPSLRIRTLGQTAVEGPNGPIDGPWLDQRTGQLLKFLVAERRRAVPIEEIGESIWPGASYAVAGSVRYYIHALRRQLEPQRGRREPSVLIDVRAGSYRLRLDRIQVDADAFEVHVSAGLAVIEGDPTTAAAQLEHGLALYRGEFLSELPYAEWALAERHRLHDLACKALHRLADIRIEQRIIDGAVRTLERLATLQPYDEDVHRRLMELDIARGRRTDAVRRYKALRSRIRRTFGVEPNFTPADLSRPSL